MTIRPDGSSITMFCPPTPDQVGQDPCGPVDCDDVFAIANVERIGHLINRHRTEVRREARIAQVIGSCRIGYTVDLRQERICARLGIRHHIDLIGRLGENNGSRPVGGRHGRRAIGGTVNDRHPTAIIDCPRGCSQAAFLERLRRSCRSQSSQQLRRVRYQPSRCLHHWWRHRSQSR